ncbi:hypothetical protein [Wolbachia endosymbiont of Oedothorax gibbosus]|uniref:hypothetical protein n=1 Tax=Wolbachia endosymbiont of Oedothorax gibbosus TaxID=931100 RepID=UPI002024A0AC|nr:hypothetical protein [Wolbachia endosymbiont of Oedothorax gibbosus]
MELKKSNNIFSTKKTDEDFLEQINKYKKQAIDIQKHSDTIARAITGQQRTLGDVPKKRPTAIETFIEKHVADIKKYDDEIENILARQKSRDYIPESVTQKQSILIKRFENLSNVVETMEREHTQDKYSSTSMGAIKEQVDVVGNAYKNLSHNLKELSDSASNIIKLIQEQKVLKTEIYELRKEELRAHYRREKASNKGTVTSDNKKRVATMEEKVNENDINIKSLCNEEKVKELNKNVENSLTKFDREIDKLETKVRNAGYETPDKSSKAGKLTLTVVKRVKELTENLKNTFVELRNKMSELREKTKHGGQENNLEAGKYTLNTQISQGKISSEKKQGMPNQDNIVNGTEIRHLTKKSKELFAVAELIGLEHDSGKHSKIGINALKEQVNAVQNVGKRLRHNLKELSDLPSNTGKLVQEQVSLRKELNKLKRENLTLDKLEKGEKVSKSTIDKKKETNSKRISTIEAKVSGNDTKIKSLSTGGKIRELSENIQNSLIDFKREVAKLETKVKSLEKGQAPKLPHQIVKPSFRPSETVIKSFEDVKGYLHTLAKNVDNHGIYEGSKEYLQRVVNYLDGFYIMESDKLQKLKTNLNKPDLTKERFTQIITALVNTIDSSNIGKFDNRLLEKATNYIYSVEDLAKEAVSKISSSAKDLYRKVTKSGSFNLNKGYEISELQGKYRVTEKLVADLESEQKKAKALKTLRYAAREFGKSVLGSESDRNKIPREQQVSIDLGNKLFFDHGNNMLLTIPNPSVYYCEVGTKDKKSYVTQDGTEVLAKRFSPEEQEKNTKIIKCNEKGEYRLFNQDGTLYDTSGKSSKGKAGEVAYGLTLDGRLVTHEHIVPYGNADKKVEYGYYHSSLLGGKPGQCFGMMTVKNGQVTKIDINSGHYKPTQENLYNAVKILQNVIADGAEIISHDFSYDKGTGQVSNPLYKGNKEQFLQRMETKGKDGLTMPERYFGVLRNYNAAYKEKLDKSSHAEKIINERKNSNERINSL